MGGKKNPYRRPDAFTRAARAKGYPARSVFKLEEIDRRVKLFRAGQHVLDLGAAPGSWSMFASQRVGPSGRVLAVDAYEIAGSLGSNVTVLRADALTTPIGELEVFAPYHVVLSDMAPATTGSRIADQARSYELFLRATEIAAALTASRGAFVGKIFMSDDFPKARAQLSAHFEQVRVIRPEGTRSSSFEVFLVGLGRRG